MILEGPCTEPRKEPELEGSSAQLQSTPWNKRDFVTRPEAKQTSLRGGLGAQLGFQLPVLPEMLGSELR